MPAKSNSKHYRKGSPKREHGRSQSPKRGGQTASNSKLSGLEKANPYPDQLVMLQVFSNGTTNFFNWHDRILPFMRAKYGRLAKCLEIGTKVYPQPDQVPRLTPQEKADDDAAGGLIQYALKEQTKMFAKQVLEDKQKLAPMYADIWNTVSLGAESRANQEADFLIISSSSTVGTPNPTTPNLTSTTTGPTAPGQSSAGGGGVSTTSSTSFPSITFTAGQSSTSSSTSALEVLLQAAPTD